MKHQEGKCRYKPAPENEVNLKMTIKNVDLNKMDETGKNELKSSLQKEIAKKADVDDDAVVVTLEQGSVKVSAAIDLEERIGIMEAENEGKEINLVKEMESIKEVVQDDMKKEDTTKELLTTATKVESVQQAADGDITLDAPETSIVAEAATKAPEIVTPAPSPSEAEAFTDAGSTTPSPSTGNGADTGDVQEGVSKATMRNSGFVSLLIASAVAVLSQ